MENSEFESPELLAKLKQGDTEVQLYVAELRAENFRLQKIIAKFEAKNISLNHRVQVLEKYREDHPDYPSMSDEQLKEDLEKLIALAQRK
jgi:hypothetical protein